MHILATIGCVFVIASFTVVYLILKTRKDLPAIVEAQKQFFTLTGYRHPEIPNAPLEEQIKFHPRRVTLADALTKGRMETRYIRPDPAGALEYTTFQILKAVPGGTAKIKRESWKLALGTPAKVQLQIVDKQIVGKANHEDRHGYTRNWKQLFPNSVAIDDAALDARFAVFGTDALTIRRILARPDVRERLLGFPEVDLVVGDRSILFSDPSGLNRDEVAVRGAAPRMLSSIPVHQKVQEMLGAIRSEVTGTAQDRSHSA